MKQKLIIEIRTYDEDFKNHVDKTYTINGDCSVITTAQELRIINHEKGQETTVINISSHDAITVRNWGK